MKHVRLLPSLVLFTSLILIYLLSQIGFYEARVYFLFLLPSVVGLIWQKSRWPAFIIGIISTTLLALEALHFWIYDTAPTSGVYIALFETDLGETKEFLRSQEISGFVLLLLASLILSLLISRWMPKLTSIAYFFLVGALILVGGSGIKDFWTRSPIRMISHFHHYLNERDDFRKRLKEIPNSNIKIHQNDISESQTVICIIGESTTRNRMSLYGYTRPTTPRLEDNKKLVVFTNTISPHTQTYRSLRKVLTLLNHDNEKTLKENIHILSLARAAGYRTYWLSNQKPLGKFENPHTIIARSAHENYWLNGELTQSEASYDEKVIHHFSKIINNKFPKKFIVLHLLGAHALYQNRFPEDFSKFTGIVPTTGLDLNTSEKKTYNDYDNAILYQDYVLSELFNLIQKIKTPYHLTYFPDHGEEAYQSVRLVGHTEAKATNNMYEIPFLFLTSDEALKIKAMANRSKLWSIEDYIHSLHRLLGVRTRFYESARDIFSEEYLERERIAGQSNYKKPAPRDRH